MSLAEQSQQWYPTSVQVTVLQARGLRIKGKNGTNDAYAIMQVAKDKFSTSVAEKSVAPMWKEEAAFDLPLFHPSNAERCTLQVCVMHRALMGPDKTLGQASVNLLELQDNKSRNKPEWFKLMGKTGKADKDRGEVLLDIQFMRNNMTASMYDLSGQDKSRSRLGKLKDKLKGKKKDGMSDSASAIVPSFGQVLTDSEGEEEPEVTPGAKKKNKLKSLFAPKPGLHRNMSQSMSTLATLPEKDSAISLSRSSGLNVESPEGKKKFKFLKHKRTGSSDSKVSQGTGSLGTGMVQGNVCINGSHVYTKAQENRAGSTFSLNSSGHGSMEDLRRGHDQKTSVDSLKTSDLKTQDNSVEEMHRKQEEQRKQEAEVRERLEEERRQAEKEERKWIEREQEKRRLEEEEVGKRLEREEEKRKLEKQIEERKRIEREEERKRIEREEERKRMEREEEKRKLEKQEEERKRIEREEERKKLEREEERKRMVKEEEKRKQEEERKKIEREEERKRIEREEEQKRMEEEKRKLEKKEVERRIEKEETERKRIEQDEMIRVKKEQERIRQEEEKRGVEEERIKEEKRKRMEEEEKTRKEEDKRRKMEEEERTRLENEKLRKKGETGKIEMERRAEEEERRRKEKEKVEAEEKRKREEERRMTEEKETKAQERLRLEKEKVEFEKKKMEERMREEQVRKMAEEEEKRKLKEKADQERIRQEKEEMERQRKEKEQRPEVKPRSARLNTSKKAPDEINSDYTPSTNPFEDLLSVDESATNPFEQATVPQPEALSRSTKVSAVKPRPHAVKPLSTTDNHPDLRETQDNSRSAAITDDMQVKMKASEAKGTGPYSQLTNEELVNLLEKQKVQLSQKDSKIGELELYIDNLLVRVMEENPAILMSLTSMKKSV
ncbi:trichohyalin isoform X2 [Rhinichthys klamathensis goyatoka]|uniref:trichohyalin isoform X2 n=1 Tax=Rhinichthys klamathensis goyatoka TaxID=3034132 RepID=UPI0024B5ED59|nr:trichohyalin isoform X2 [Rhinichthys klamathensis goyatoka]